MSLHSTQYRYRVKTKSRRYVLRNCKAMLGKHSSVLPKGESNCVCVDCFQPNTEDRIGVIFLIRTISSTESMDEKKNQIVFPEKAATG